MGWYLKVMKDFANFSGRARRQEYWMFFLINLLISIALAFVENLIGMGGEQIGGGIISWIYALIVLIPGIAVSVRRLHDTGRAGWWLLLIFLPLIGALVLLVFFCLDSEPGDNQYGPNPK